MPCHFSALAERCHALYYKYITCVVHEVAWHLSATVVKEHLPEGNAIGHAELCVMTSFHQQLQRFASVST